MEDPHPNPDPTPVPVRKVRQTIARIAERHPTVGGFIRAFNGEPPRGKDIGFEPISQLAPGIAAKRSPPPRSRTELALRWTAVFLPCTVFVVLVFYLCYRLYVFFCP